MSWWHQASTEDRLAQIDGGLEVGMTSAQVGMNCGCSGESVRTFAAQHGRSFVGVSDGPSRAGKRIQSINADRRAFFSGEPVEMWSA